MKSISHFDKRIRLANVNDVDAIFSIRMSVNENRLSLERLAEMGITSGSVRKTILAASSVWLAEVGKIPAGFSMGDVAAGSVFALFVRPEFEGLGLGRALLSHVEAFLFHHHDKIWLETDGNSRASGFYRRQGWQPVEYLADGDVRFQKSIE